MCVWVSDSIDQSFGTSWFDGFKRLRCAYRLHSNDVTGVKVQSRSINERHKALQHSNLSVFSVCSTALMLIKGRVN